MTQNFSEVKTFKQACEQLREMAAGKSHTLQVEHNSYMEPQLRVGLYIADVAWVFATTWQLAFLEMEQRIRALDPNHNADELAEGVDEAMQTPAEPLEELRSEVVA